MTNMPQVRGLKALNEVFLYAGVQRGYSIVNE